MKNNYYTYLTNDGRSYGAFNIYQAANGRIAMAIGSGFTVLSMKQIEELRINVYTLIDFDYDDFCNAYPQEIYSIPR